MEQLFPFCSFLKEPDWIPTSPFSVMEGVVSFAFSPAEDDAKLTFSTYEPYDDITAERWTEAVGKSHEFRERTVEPIQVDAFEGFYYRYDSGNFSIRGWILSHDNTVLDVVYRCATEIVGRDDERRAALLYSIFETVMQSCTPGIMLVSLTITISRPDSSPSASDPHWLINLRSVSASSAGLTSGMMPHIRFI